jgi:hypothetical protein
MEDVLISKMVVDIEKQKDRDGRDVFTVSRRQVGKAGSFDVAGSTGATYSSWQRVLAELEDLNLPTRLLDGVKRMVDTVGSATINLPLD